MACTARARLRITRHPIVSPPRSQSTDPCMRMFPSSNHSLGVIFTIGKDCLCTPICSQSNLTYPPSHHPILPRPSHHYQCPRTAQNTPLQPIKSTISRQPL